MSFRHLDIAKRRDDERAGVVALIGDVLAVTREVLEVLLERRRNGQRPSDPGGGVRPLHMKRARLVLRLGEIEDNHAVGVAEIVGDPDRLDPIVLPAAIGPQQPLAGRRRLATAAARLAVAKVQTLFDGAVVRLGARRQF